MATMTDNRTDREAVLAPTLEEGGKKPPTAGGGGKKPRRWRWFALIALIILIVGGGAGILVPYLHTTLAADAATVTITPMSQHLASTYTITAVTTKPNASQQQVGARLLSSTMTKSVTVKATGIGHQDATTATGVISFSSMSGTLPKGGYRISGKSGEVIQFTLSTPLTPDKHWFVLCEAQNPGPSGNIPAYDIDGSYGYGDVTFYAQNEEPFTGGQDAFDYTFVQQSDISAPATELMNQLTSDTKSAVQKQIQVQEQLIGDMQVIPKTSANHQADDRASDVTVSVSVTTKAEVYKPQEAQSLAMKLLKSDAIARFGADYTLAGAIVAAPPTVQTIGNDGIVTLKVKTEGVWAYHLSAAQLHSMAQAIAGKTQADALTLLRKQQGVNKISISTSGGWGTALPTAPGNITLKVQAVPGLKAT